MKIIKDKMWNNMRCVEFIDDKGVNQKIVAFFTYKEPFSNFYNTKVMYEGETFHHTEAAFMYSKALTFDPDPKVLNNIVKCYNPKQVKALGRAVRNYKESVWEVLSYQKMKDVLYAKFSQNEKLKQILLMTGDATIVEASPYDKKWGCGYGKNSEQIVTEFGRYKGSNLLGKALMETRELLKNQQD